MSDEIRMTLLHHSTNDLIEELLMWRGRAAELLDRITELEGKIDQLTARWRQERQDDKWIPVSERLPEDRATILAAFTEYPEQIDILTATYYKRYEGFGGIDNWWDIEGWHSGNVTHWMPLPQPPEVQP